MAAAGLPVRPQCRRTCGRWGQQQQQHQLPLAHWTQQRSLLQLQLLPLALLLLLLLPPLLLSPPPCWQRTRARCPHWQMPSPCPPPPPPSRASWQRNTAPSLQPCAMRLRWCGGH